MEKTESIEALAERGVSQRGPALSNTFLKWSAVFLSLGAIGLHLLGYVSHRAYLETWGVDPGLFAKPVDWLLIHGDDVVFLSFAYLWFLLKQHIVWLVFYGVLVFVGAFVSIKKPDLSARHIIRSGLRFLPEKIAEIVLMLIVTVVLCVFIFLAPLLAAGFVYVPTLIGEWHGSNVAKEELAAFGEGCAQRKQKARCVQLKRAGQPTVIGFVLDSSESHVAIYVVSSCTVQVFKRDSFDVEEGSVASVW